MTYRPKTLGILGGGQLGRMTAMAAARLGIKTHIYCPDDGSPASQVAAQTFNGAYDDKALLKNFADSVDAITYEFENIPVETVWFLQTLKPVYPDDRLLEVCQNRITEKQFLNDAGIMTGQWAACRSPEELETVLGGLEFNEYIFKTSRFGYDGKGQVFCGLNEDSAVKYKELNHSEIIIEEVIDFHCEISVIAARDKMGQIATYGPVKNDHKNHILSRSTAPANIPDQLADQACRMTCQLAEAVDLVGVLALEMFVTRDGCILANEIAPRPHNSGHWTIDACTVSQFEQQARTVCGLPVGIPNQHSPAEMFNLLGRDVENLDKWWETEGSSIHIYGKKDVRPGRKMGHVTVLKSKIQ